MRLQQRILLGAGVLVVALAPLTIAVATPFVATRAPANDSFARARAVGVSGVISGTTAGAGAQPGQPGVAAGDRTVWFAWTPSQPGAAFVVATGPGEAVSVRAYTGARLRTLVRADVAGGGGQHVLATIDAFAGVTYRIQVDAGTASGRFALQVVQPQPGRPANATIATATPLGQAIRDAVTADGSSAAALTGTTAGAGGNEHAVYYRWTAPAGTSGRLQVGLAGVTRGARLALALAGHADARELSLDAVAGRTYTLRVSGEQAYFALKLTPLASFRLDTTPPSIHCAVPNGWRHTNAAVRCRASDGGSGLDDRAQRAFTLHTAVPRGTATATAATSSVNVCDRAGNCATAGPFTGLQIDRAPPTVTCAPAASIRWQQPVTVDCQATGAPGGAPLTDPAARSFALTATLPPGHASRHVRFASHNPICDLAGNCTRVPAPAPVAIDHVAPRVSCGRPPSGWVTGASIRCTAADAQSGLASPSDASFTLTTTTAAGTASAHAYTNAHAVCDLAGNCATAGPIGPLKVDREPPVVTCHAPRGWVRGHVAFVPCRAIDPGSGLARLGEGSFSLRAQIAAGTEGQAQTAPRQVCDRAGNCALVGPFTVKLDGKPPSIACDEVPRGWQAATVTIGCTATDYGSGVSPQRQLVLLQASIGRGGAGSVAFPRVRICDRAGNCARTPRLPRVRIDRRPPALTCSQPRAGRHRHNVTVYCRASDGRGSGLAIRSDAAFALRTDVPPGQTDRFALTGTLVVCDKVGNCVTAGPFGPFDVAQR